MVGALFAALAAAVGGLFLRAEIPQHADSHGEPVPATADAD